MINVSKDIPAKLEPTVDGLGFAVTLYFESSEAAIDHILNSYNDQEVHEVKNTRGKTVSRSEAYEVWQTPDGSWTWYVLKAWQGDDDKPYARWFCDVVTPMCPHGEMGDVYVSEIKANAVRVYPNEHQDGLYSDDYAVDEVDLCRHPIINITGYTEGGDTIGVCFFCEAEVGR